MNYDLKNTVGSDEAGVGDYFGPMTVCAAYLPAKSMELVRELGVKDSKNLSNSTVQKLAADLIHTVTYSLVVLDNPSYNMKIDEGWNIVKLKAVLHDHCIKNVYDKLTQDEQDDVDVVLIDQFTTLNAYHKYVQDPHPADKITQETKAESKSLAVAAASIIARAKYLEQMSNLNSTLNQTVPRGASKKVDAFAASLAKKYGMNYVDQLTKKHFKSREKVLDILNA